VSLILHNLPGVAGRICAPLRPDSMPVISVLDAMVSRVNVSEGMDSNVVVDDLQSQNFEFHA
jgi:hypothetical protein